MGPIEFAINLNSIIENINKNDTDNFLESIEKINKLLRSVKQTDKYQECLNILNTTLEHAYIVDTEPYIDYSKALNYSKTMTSNEKANYLVQNLRMVLGEQTLLKVATSSTTHDRLKAPLKQDRYSIKNENFRGEERALVELLERIHGEKAGIFFDECNITDYSSILKQKSKSHDFSIATIDGKKYIIDLSYRQFFTLTNSNVKEDGVDIQLNPLIFMLQTSNKRNILEQMLKYGFIEATPENLKNYAESIITAFLGKDSINQEILSRDFYEKYLNKGISQEKIPMNDQEDNKTKQQTFICESVPYIQKDVDDEYNINMSAQEILTRIVQKERRHLMKQHDLLSEGLSGECEGSTKRIMLDCTSKGFDAVFLAPGYYSPKKTRLVDGKNINIPRAEGHNCTFVDIHHKNYIIDCTYRQFFLDDGREHCGKYMLTDKKREGVARQILKYGWIEATPENIKAYMDGFEMARMKSFEDTGTSPDEYIGRLVAHKEFPIRMSGYNNQGIDMTLKQAIEEFEKNGGKLQEEKEENLDRKLSAFLNENRNIDSIIDFVNNLIEQVYDKMTKEITTEDVKTRLENFSKRIETIRSNPQFQIETSIQDDKLQELYSKISILSQNTSQLVKVFSQGTRSTIITDLVEMDNAEQFDYVRQMLMRIGYQTDVLDKEYGRVMLRKNSRLLDIVKEENAKKNKRKLLGSISLNTELEQEAQVRVHKDMQEMISKRINEKQ
ncbi:MAG: hypothetical protein KIC60_03100 [Clostridium sp.]|nr:hypothetical protein [Clostridium sp.]